MSITREEAIELKAAVGRLMYSDNKDIRDYNALIDFIDTALRPVSREQVEKVWRGCDLCLDDSWERRLMIPKRFDHATLLSGELALFCPGCGRPMTDEAVGMVMERLEELNGA